MQTAPAAPFLLGPGEGTPTWFFGSIATLKIDGPGTAGAFSLLEQHCPPGFANPFHVHRREDEAFWILEGELEVFVGEGRFVAGPVSFILGLRYVPHGFRVRGDVPCRLLLLASPPAFEEFVREMGEPAQGHGFPPPGPPSMEKLLPLSEKYGIEILGPLPD